MSDVHIDPDGRKWRRTTGHSGYRRREDGSMYFDVHTGQGRSTFWTEVIPPPTCKDCGKPIPGGYWAEQNHERKCEGATT